MSLDSALLELTINRLLVEYLQNGDPNYPTVGFLFCIRLLIYLSLNMNQSPSNVIKNSLFPTDKGTSKYDIIAPGTPHAQNGALYALPIFLCGQYLCRHIHKLNSIDTQRQRGEQMHILHSAFFHRRSNWLITVE